MLIFLFTANKLKAFDTVGKNSFMQITIDVYQVAQEERNLISTTEEYIEACNSIAEEEFSQTCFSELHQLFTLSRDDILGRLMELYQTGRQALNLVERSMESLHMENRYFVWQSSTVTIAELTECIQNL